MTELEHLIKKHKQLHDTVESLEAEKAPEAIIKRAKAEKLAIKTRINTMSAIVD